MLFSFHVKRISFLMSVIYRLTCRYSMLRNAKLTWRRAKSNERSGNFISAILEWRWFIFDVFNTKVKTAFIIDVLFKKRYDIHIYLFSMRRFKVMGKISLFNISPLQFNVLSSGIGSIWVNMITSDWKVAVKAKNKNCST